MGYLGYRFSFSEHREASSLTNHYLSLSLLLIPIIRLGPAVTCAPPCSPTIVDRQLLCRGFAGDIGTRDLVSLVASSPTLPGHRSIPSKLLSENRTRALLLALPLFHTYTFTFCSPSLQSWILLNSTEDGSFSGRAEGYIALNSA